MAINRSIPVYSALSDNHSEVTVIEGYNSSVNCQWSSDFKGSLRSTLSVNCQSSSHFKGSFSFIIIIYTPYSYNNIL